MKKILLSFILLLSATIGMAQDFKEVSTLKELLDALDEAYNEDTHASNAKIKLTADIYLDGNSVKFAGIFSGVIDGDYVHTDPDTGKKIHANHIIHGGKETANPDDHKPILCNYFFLEMEGAELRNITFCNIRVQDEEEDNLGMITRSAKDCKFENIIADNISVFCNKSNAGTLVGRAEFCEFNGIMIATSDVTTDGICAGGIVGHSFYSKYNLCLNNVSSSVFADGNNFENDGISGGIVGNSNDDTFNSCYNYAMIGADQCELGGITGKSSNSNFYRCTNYGTVYHCDSDEFEEACKNQREQCKNITFDQVLTTANDLFGDDAITDDSFIDVYTHSAMAYVIATASQSDRIYKNAIKFVSDVSMNSIQQSMQHITNPSYGTGGAFSGIAAAILAGFSAFSYTLAAGDDEVGGITGQAERGIFEYCINAGMLGCKDDNLGGIVGLGYGVTINNCMNTGDLRINEEDTSGSIIGRKEGASSKITNCCSSITLPIIGSYEGSMDHTSGNNYFVKGGDIAPSDWDKEVDKQLMNNGTVAYWLNNGIENREKGIKPWHQNLWARNYHGTRINPDLYPLLDASHDEVNIDLLYDNWGNDEHTYLISTPERLLEFASAVNNGNQFARGFLTKDINMEGIEWTPIGKDATNCQFRGVFDGKGHTISGLTYTSENNEPAGLFGAVHAGADIRNVIIGKGSKFCGPNQYDKEDAGAGGIVGQVKMGDAWKWGNVFIENCGSYADIEVGRHGGGILGNVDVDGEGVRVYVNNCFSMGTISATNSNSALLCGYMKNHGIVHNCWSGGKLEGPYDGPIPYDKNNNGGGKAECLVGYNSGLNINNCYIVDPDYNIVKWVLESAPLQDGVTIVNAEDLPNGKLAYKLNGETNDATKSLTWEQNLGSDSNPVWGDKGIYHVRNIKKEYGTICLPYTLYSNDDIKYYAFSDVTTDEGETQLKFTYTDKVKPGTPALFYTKAMGDYTFIDDLEKFEGDDDKYNFGLSIETGNNLWKMHSHPFEKVFEGDEAKTVYYVSDKEIRNAKKTTVAPYRAYFRGPSIEKLQSGGYAKVIIVFEDENGEETSIELVGDDFIPVLNNGKTYSLMGTEVGEGYRGIVINNGKKVLRK